MSPLLCQLSYAATSNQANARYRDQVLSSKLSDPPFAPNRIL